MDAKELRIGNLVQRTFTMPELGEIEGQAFAINHIMLRDCVHYGDKWAFGPIPLSEEWLVRMGCEDNFIFHIGHDTSLWKIQVLTNHENAVWSWTFDNEMNCYLRKCKYVHEFQNLYYLLKGREIEINQVARKE